ncbi:class I SAM-dependent methyltransferase [Leucobacter chromiireducens]|uniref:Class I SAM-dependent methyltransferase n=1 Tax=Leucobacter chromiireducens subsp. solipictus TaxID=398235 RepID=A0ABS1SE31_9MICO|nr:class I SAM-dependent methyltransferase [Leucobacter chromiireducens]MBL3678804.1 class I SAM-dependent methyltransferase [Leucobacter chromiireducens subsp. solipictus]
MAAGTAAVSAAYEARVAEYIDVVGTIDRAARVDQDDILAWAQDLAGPILDVGCGPGQWTHLLHSRGLKISGIDPVRGFIADAQRRYPDVSYALGEATALPVHNGTLGGVLSWFSLIHSEPARLDRPLAEFARALAPGGGLALGYFDGPHGEPFDHAITTAFTWSAEGITALVEEAGFEVVSVRSRTDGGTRPVGTLIATRNVTREGNEPEPSAQPAATMRGTRAEQGRTC